MLVQCLNYTITYVPVMFKFSLLSPNICRDYPRSTAVMTHACNILVFDFKIVLILCQYINISYAFYTLLLQRVLIWH